METEKMLNQLINRLKYLNYLKTIVNIKYLIKHTQQTNQTIPHAKVQAVQNLSNELASQHLRK